MPTTERAAARPGGGRRVARPPKPKALPVLFDNAPTALRERPRWVLWRYEWSTSKSKWDKPPQRPDGSGRAKSNDPGTWGTFDEVRAAYQAGGFDGVGFVTGDRVTAGDGDGCRDLGTGDLTVRALSVLALANTYAEVSPSAEGVRFWALTDGLPGEDRRRDGMELYPSGQYLTFTGQRLDGYPTELQERTSELARVYGAYIAHSKPVAAPTAAAQLPAVGTNGVHLSDDAVLAHLRKSNPAMWTLFDTGDLSNYVNADTGKPDQSAAEFALAGALAWWSGYRMDQVDRLVRRSKLMRPKWDERRGATTYGERTLANVLARRDDAGYTGHAAEASPSLAPNPRDPDDPGPGDEVASTLTVMGASTSKSGALVAEPDEALAYFADSDAGNAERLAHRVGNRLLYAPGLGWHLWDGRHYAPDPNELVLREALTTMRATLATAELLTNDERRRTLRQHARASESVGRLRAMLDIAANLPAFFRPSDQLDADPWVLNTESGLLDLRTATLRPHDPAALCTKLAPVRFDLDAEHPAVAALLDILDRDGRAEYLRSLAGQALTGRNTKTLFVAVGDSGTVKSTFADALMATLGAYGVTVEPATLLASKHGNTAGGARADLVALRGARFAVAAELPHGGKLDSELVKRLSGADEITCRAPHATKVVRFRPGHTLLVHSNHHPRADWTDSGLRARLSVVPFRVKPDDPDPRVRQQLVEDPDARAAFLAWAAVGAVAWHQAGERMPDPPNVVKECTREYWTDQDPFSAWADEALLFDGNPNTFTLTADLAASYREWTEREGVKFAQGTKSLGRWLADQGTERNVPVTAELRRLRDGRRGRGWCGVRLRTPQDEDDPA